jgi:cation transport ATPase
MSNSIIGEFSVLSPSQKREFERKRKEQEARETAEAIHKAETARKAREAAKRAEEERLAAIRAENAARDAEKQTKRTLWVLLVLAIIALMIITIYYWFHVTGEIVRDENGNITGDAIIGAIIIWALLGFVAGPILVGLGVAISGCSDKIKALK